MCGVVLLGGLIWRQSIDNSYIEACVFGMIAFSVFAVGAGFADARVAGRRAEALVLEPPAESGLNAAEQRFAADLALIVKLLQAHVTANAGYSESLARANADLPQLNTPEEIRAVVLTLIEENRKIQTKMDELSASLDKSVNKIEKLRSNLVEANDKAMRDPLTGLGNRRFFDQEIDLALGDAEALCLLMCDLDRFKAINDKFGHAVGDMVLKQFADILSAAARRDDFVGADRRRRIRPRHARHFADRGGAARRADPPPARGEEVDARQRNPARRRDGLVRGRAPTRQRHRVRPLQARRRRPLSRQVGRPQSRLRRSRRLKSSPRALVARRECVSERQRRRRLADCAGVSLSGLTRRRAPRRSRVESAKGQAAN